MFLIDSCEVDAIIVSILQKRKLRLRESTWRLCHRKAEKPSGTNLYPHHEQHEVIVSEAKGAHHGKSLRSLQPLFPS